MHIKIITLLFSVFFQNFLYADSFSGIEKIDNLILENIKLNQRLDALEKNKVSHKELGVNIHGYVKADMLYDIKGKSGDRVNYFTIPIDGTDEASDTGHFRIHSKESRLNLTSKSLTKYGLLKVFIEMDFFGDGTESAPGSELISNSVKPRLRHAFVKIGPLLVGQAWSNFVDVKSFPENLDLANDTGQAFLFQPQVRFTKVVHRIITSLSIENPESDFTLADRSKPTCGSGKDPLPDLTMKILYRNNESHLSVQGVLREIESRCGKKSTSKTGFGLGISGKVTISNSNSMRFHFSHGKGIGRYIQEASNSAAVLYSNDSRFDLSTQTAWGGYIGFQHKWNTVLRSNINTGITSINWEDEFIKNHVVERPTIKRYQSAHINLIWRWLEHSDVGIEYSTANIKRIDEKQGRINRIQMSLKYLF